MKTIIPPHLKAAHGVENISSIIPEAIEICKGIQDKIFSPPGSQYTDCFAMAQPQVSDNPLRYFVINPVLGASVAKDLGGLVIINPHIISKDRTSRLMHPEGCMSYPFRAVKKVKRFNRIIVSYESIKDISNSKLITSDRIEEKEISGMTAMVFQHELEHLNGQSIYS